MIRSPVRAIALPDPMSFALTSPLAAEQAAHPGSPDGAAGTAMRSQKRGHVHTFLSALGAACVALIGFHPLAAASPPSETGEWSASGRVGVVARRGTFATSARQAQRFSGTMVLDANGGYRTTGNGVTCPDGSPFPDEGGTWLFDADRHTYVLDPTDFRAMLDA